MLFLSSLELKTEKNIFIYFVTKMKNYKFCFLKEIIIGIILISFSSSGFGQKNNPVTNYNYFVNFIKENYGLFPYKNVNWDSLGKYYSNFVSDTTSSDSLFYTMSRLAAKLRDKHFWIDNERYAYNYSIGKVVKTSQMDSIFASRKILKNTDLIKSKYLGNNFESSGINDFIFGKIDNDIGYVSFNWFDKDVKKVDAEMVKILRNLKECQSLIIDIRNNIGGTDSSALTVANHLIEMDRCYQISRIRKSNYDYSYTEPKLWYTSHCKEAYNKPLIILINRYTISAAEAFSLALKGQSHIIFMGEPTAGAFSDAEDKYLPNGWHFAYSIGVWTDCNEVLWEEKGIQPDVNLDYLSKECSKSDLYLEHAISVLNKN
jgi:hypothetical protein